LDIPCPDDLRLTKAGPKSKLQKIIGEPNKDVPKPFRLNPQHGGAHHAAHMRGGAGTDGPEIYLYGPSGSRLTCPSKITDDYATFEEQALRLLSLDKSSNWEFVVDQYNNQEMNKGKTLKSFARTFPVKKCDSQDMWESYLKARLNNRYSDWPLVVNHPRQAGVAAPQTFILPKTDSIPNTQTSSFQTNPVNAPPATNPPSQKKVSSMKPLPKKPEPVITPPATNPSLPKKPPPKKPVKTILSPVKPTTVPPPKESLPLETTARNMYNIQGDKRGVNPTDAYYFRHFAGELLGLGEAMDDGKDWQFSVSFYEQPYTDPLPVVLTDDDLEPRLYCHTVHVQKKNWEQTYLRDIRPELFSNPPRYWTVFHRNKNEAPDIFPDYLGPEGVLASLPEKDPDPPVPGDSYSSPLFAYYPDHGVGAWDMVLVESHIEAFLRGAQQLLDLDEDNPHWTFHVDLYWSDESSNPGPIKVFHSYTITKATLTQNFANIRPYIFDGGMKWKVVVRTTPTRFEEATLVDERVYVYGYRGRVMTSPNKISFLQSAYQLLGLRKGTQWAFTIDVHDNQSSSIEVDPSTYDDQFDKKTLKLLQQSSTEHVLFLRFNDQPVASSLEPDRTLKHVIILERPNVSSAYWKIPINTSPVYGINQCQKGFTDAMQVLFPPGNTRTAKGHKFRHPAQHIYVGPFNIGWGGMEATKELWDFLKAPRDQSGNRFFEVRLRPPDRANEDERSTLHTGIRLVGSEHSGKANPGDYNRIYKEIVSLASSQLASTPTTVRVWKQARSREVDEELATESEKHAVIALEPKAEAVTALKALFAKDPQTTSCVWFRPEWETFAVVNADGGTVNADWYPVNGSKLFNFRDDVLKQLGYDEKNSFSIVDTHDKLKFHIHGDGDLADGSKRDANNKVTNPDTEWRLHVYDWFHSSNLEVKLLDEGTPIGYGKLSQVL
jgi:hypothetical protein